MRIEHYVSVFSLVLILVIAYKYIISKKIAFKEIFIFSIVFSIIDYVIIITSGNTLFSETNVMSTTQMIVFQILLIGALLFSLCWFFYQLYKNHRWYLLRLIMLGFIVITLILF